MIDLSLLRVWSEGRYWAWVMYYVLLLSDNGGTVSCNRGILGVPYMCV